MRRKRKFYRLNYYIQAPTLRLLDEKGKQLGIFSRQEALEKAKRFGVDLVEIVPKAKPPVCRLIDFKKFRYLEEKRKRGEKKKGKEVEVKEIHLRPFIGEHDYKIRLKKMKKFLKEGSRVRIRVKFFGREIVKKNFGYEIINRFLKDLGDKVKVEREPHFVGKVLVVQISPISPKK